MTVSHVSRISTTSNPLDQIVPTSHEATESSLVPCGPAGPVSPSTAGTRLRAIANPKCAIAPKARNTLGQERAEEAEVPPKGQADTEAHNIAPQSQISKGVRRPSAWPSLSHIEMVSCWWRGSKYSRCPATSAPYGGMRHEHYPHYHNCYHRPGFPRLYPSQG